MKYYIFFFGKRKNKTVKIFLNNMNRKYDFLKFLPNFLSLPNI